RFTAAGYVNTVSTSTSMGTADSARTTNYEDIRFNPDLSRFAALASNNDSGAFSSGTNRVRLMSFNAATGVPGLVNQATFTRASSAHGYSIEFAPNGGYLYATRIGNTSTAGTLFRASVTATLGTFDSSATAPSSNRGGAVRAGSDGRLYW